MKIRTVVTSVALGVGMLVASPGPASAEAPPTPVVAPSDTFEAYVVHMTNQQRADRHKVKLTPQACVDRYAEAHAAWMARNRVMKHQSMRTILKACGLRSVGENVAWGYRTGSLTVAAWMRSRGHKKNIVKSRYRLIGVGAVQNKYGRWWVAQVFGTRR